MNLIITHKNADFDALAAAVAAAKLHHYAQILMPEPLQPNVRSFVNLYRDMLPLGNYREVRTNVKSITVVDTNDRKRLGDLAHLLDCTENIIVYDHHPGEQNLGATIVRIEPVGATTTLLVEELRNREIPISEFEATLFILGIFEDTGCLTYDLTTVRDAEAVADLWKSGVTTRLFSEYLRTPLSDDQKYLLESLISNSEIIEMNNRRILISTTLIDHYIRGAAVLIRMLDEIEDASLTVVIIQMAKNVYLAARTQKSELNLVKLFAPLGAGGHPGAVSAYLKNTTAASVKTKLIELMHTKLPPAVTAGQVASKPVFTISSDTTVAETEVLLTRHNYKGCPVTENGRLVGIISRRDLRKAIHSKLEHAPVSGYMQRKIITASPDETLNGLRRLMVDNNIGRIPIVDQNDRIVGIVTRTDLLRCLNNLDRHGSLTTSKLELFTESSKKAAAYSSRYIEGNTNNISDLLNQELTLKMQQLLKCISKQADKKNVKVYLVGGTIRDLLLHYPPAKDLDLVIIGDAIHFAAAVQEELGGELRTFEKFGTASLQLEDRIRLDMVTARKEFYASPAALPQVEASTLKNDLFRRDFTINTMACSLMAANYGELYDYFDGRKDLRKKIIRTLYSLSFVDDPLRLLRAVRFEQRYGFQIATETLKLIENAVARSIIEKVKRQRLNQELRLIYQEPQPVKVLIRYEQLGFLQFLYPGLTIGQSKWALLVKIEAYIRRVKKSTDSAMPDIELTYLCGLLFSLETAERSAIINKLQLSRDRQTVLALASKEVYVLLDQLDRNNLDHSTISELLDPLPVEVLILIGVLTEKKRIREYLQLYMEKIRHIRPKLSGNDLKRIGLKPGPRYREVLDHLKNAVLDGEVRTPQEEFNYVIDYLENRGGKEE